MKRKKLIIYILLIITIALWGISLVITKEIFAADSHFTAAIIVFFRLLFSSILFVPILFISKKACKIQKGDLKYFLLLAFFEPFLYFLCENSGLQYVSSGIASVMIASIPVFIPFGMYLLYREKLMLSHVVGVVMSLFGVSVMILGDTGDFSADIRGIALLTIAILVAVSYTLFLVKIVNKYPPITITVYQNVIGLFYFLPLVILGNMDNLQAICFTPKVIALIAILGIGCSTFAYICFNYGVQNLGATRTAVFNNATPVFTLLFATMLGQESLNVWKIAGMIIAIAGVSISQFKK